MATLPKKPGAKYCTGRERQREEKGEQVHVVRLFGDDAEMLERTAESLEDPFTTPLATTSTSWVSSGSCCSSASW